MQNNEVAELLAEAALLLERQGANPFRAHAYSRAAEVVRSLPRPIESVLHERGEDGLRELPGIGESLAKSLGRLIETGRFTLLERLRIENEPEHVLSTVGGIGPVLARRLRDDLQVESLEDLDKVVANGSLARVPGFGEKRLRAIRESLAGRLRRAPEPSGSEAGSERRDHNEARISAQNDPEVSVILDIDHEYREKVRLHSLPRLTPKRYNPTKEAWLPVLRTDREGRSYTALYSNSARAHELGTTRDWVVVYREEIQGDGQWTVITSQFGSLRGKRIIRGREIECKRYYDELESGPTVGQIPRSVAVPFDFTESDASPHSRSRPPKRRIRSTAEGGEAAPESDRTSH